MNELFFVGLMSGTSIDGMDAALLAVEPVSGRCRCVGTLFEPWPEHCRRLLHRLCSSGSEEIDRAGLAANAVAVFSACVARKLIARHDLQPEQICAIGSHGQTVRHRPERGFSVQLNNGPLTALSSGIDTWTDFRAQDMAAGGEGAPLTPLFHQKMFASADHPVCVVNLGGIANMTVLEPGGRIAAGYDVGPANTLLDLVCRLLLHIPHDEGGRIAATGSLNREWLRSMHEHPYLSLLPPKSCGREQFGEEFLRPYIRQCLQDPQQIPNLLYTLCHFTVSVIAAEIQEYSSNFNSPCRVLLCGGGVHNDFLIKMLRDFLTGQEGFDPCLSTQDFGIDPDFVEAQAFAYFAYQSTFGQSVDLSAITGSSRPVILGSLSPAPNGRYAASVLQRLHV